MLRIQTPAEAAQWMEIARMSMAQVPPNRPAKDAGKTLQVREQHASMRQQTLPVDRKLEVSELIHQGRDES
jgi:hypothetical protein